MPSVQYTAIQAGQRQHVFPPKLLYIRISGFIILEEAFLILAALTFIHPLIIDTFLGPTDGKAVFTVAFILWHFFVTQCLDAIMQHIFASGWQYIAQKSHTLDPGRTDRVSTLVSGFIDFIPHFFTRRSSHAFRIALPAQLICLAIRALLPGAIVFTSVQVDTPILLEVANIPSADSLLDLVLERSRAELVVRVETWENATFGLDTEKNWVVGWPIDTQKRI